MSLKTICRRGRWAVMLWTAPSEWELFPQRSTYWSGELIHWQWLCFELVRDKRKDWRTDLHGSAAKKSLGGEAGK